MYILVNGTTVTGYSDEPITGNGVPFEIDDADFPGMEYGFILHWDGIKWWYERDQASPDEVLTALFSLQPEMIEQLPDDSLARMATYMQEWEPDTAYEAGNLRSYLDWPYRCLQAHTSQKTWNPVDAPSLWAKVLIPDPSVIPEWEQPGSTNPYMKGDKVTHNGKTWVSDIDNNVWEPGVYGWSEVEAEGE